MVVGEYFEMQNLSRVFFFRIYVATLEEKFVSYFDITTFFFTGRL